jgi:starch phosphorylase
MSPAAAWVRGIVDTLLPAHVKEFGTLAGLALDLRWSWSHDADAIWKRLDPALWDMTHNPWDILQTVSRVRFQKASQDPEFRRKVRALASARRREAAAPAWFQKAHPNSPLSGVAYFSMEFMLSEALPIYSGGLGNVAGDLLKTASDLGLPMIGIGLLYQQGYFRQVIDQSGSQQALHPYNEPGQLPITPVREKDGERLRLVVPLPGSPVWVRAWQVQVGRAALYLLDSNDAANPPAYRGITGELYGGGPELRLQQEIVLGIGGWRLLSALGLRPEVCHLNEGHAALAVLDRARGFMESAECPFETALTATRAGNLFTTHTAVPAGFDLFPPALVEQYLGEYARTKLGLSIKELLALGRRNPGDGDEPFNMSYLAVRGSGAANGVSCLHGQVSRRIFSPVFPRWPEAEIPVGHVTNGVHMPTWDSAEADELWTESCGKNRWLGDIDTMEQEMRRVPDARLWRLRSEALGGFVEFVRDRAACQAAARGGGPEEIEEAGRVFDPGVLTLGFARRFATYKRPNLLLHDPERLLRILNDPHRPVQLVVAGKAHPADAAGIALILEWTRFIRRPEARRRVVFLSDYDMFLTGRLVQGVDVWINTPRRPWEASGTSGMKILVNGGLNLSELDGWWAEAYSPEVGWAIGDGREHGEDPAWDAAEAEALYALLENEVVPEFYARDESGIPRAWVARMRESLARLTPRFSANRTVREYAESHYLPAAQAFLSRSARKGEEAGKIVAWRRDLDRGWPSLRFGEAQVSSDGSGHDFEIRVHLGEIDPEAVRVELFAMGLDAGEPERREMTRVRDPEGPEKSFVYRARVSGGRPAGEYTARIIPRRDGVSVPLESSHILWEK